MENQHRKIAGYRDLNREEISTINSLKITERRALGAIEEAELMCPDLDRRCLALGKTNLETAFMYLVKAIAQPTQTAPEEDLNGELFGHGESDETALFCPNCGNRDSAMLTDGAELPPCSAECEPFTRMKPIGQPPQQPRAGDLTLPDDDAALDTE